MNENVCEQEQDNLEYSSTSMISLDEEAYSGICDPNVKNLDKLHLIKSCCLLNSTYPNMRCEIIYELFYEVAKFGAENLLDLASVGFLLKLVEKELEFLRSRSLDALSFSNELGSDKDSLKRFLKNAQSPTPEIALPVATMKKISAFYTERFVRYLDSYQFILQEMPMEKYIEKDVVIDTPYIPLPLSESMAGMDE